MGYPRAEHIDGGVIPVTRERAKASGQWKDRRDNTRGVFEELTEQIIEEMTATRHP
jgi:hypothetical protein